MKKSKVSCIVTTKNEQKNIKNCLVSLKKQTYKNIEIIVVDNKSTDRTKDIAKNYTSYIYDKGPERSAQRNFGAHKAHGAYVLFLDADMILSPKVVEKCIQEIEGSSLLHALVIPEKSFGKGFWAQCKALERSFYVGVEWMEAARFYNKKTFLKLHGYDEKQTGTEDFDLPQRLIASSGSESVGRINEFILHNEGELSLIKTLKKKNYYARTLIAYKKIKSNREQFGKQANILNRYKLYFSKPGKLLSHPVVSAGMIFMKTSEFAAGALGYLFK